MKNAWFKGALPALLIHCSIGTVYCWSLFKSNIGEMLNIATPEWAFPLTGAIIRQPHLVDVVAVVKIV